jgi:predicted nucleic acid-binding protein
LSLVIDSSVALAWVLPDELNVIADRVLLRVSDEGALVPPIFRAEVGNSLNVALRRKRIDGDGRLYALKQLSGFTIVVDPDADEHIWSEAIDLADRHQLTLYDASYLELALRSAFPLVTLDKRLARAARDAGLRPLDGLDA